MARKTKTGVVVRRYEVNTPEGYQGTIEPKNKSWILYYRDDGEGLLFRRDKDGSVIEPGIPTRLQNPQQGVLVDADTADTYDIDLVTGKRIATFVDKNKELEYLWQLVLDGMSFDVAKIHAHHEAKQPIPNSALTWENLHTAHGELTIYKNHLASIRTGSTGIAYYLMYRADPYQVNVQYHPAVRDALAKVTWQFTDKTDLMKLVHTYGLKHGGPYKVHDGNAELPAPGTKLREAWEKKSRERNAVADRVWNLVFLRIREQMHIRSQTKNSVQGPNEVLISQTEAADQGLVVFLSDPSNLENLAHRASPYYLLLKSWSFHKRDGAWHFPWESQPETNVESLIKNLPQREEEEVPKRREERNIEDMVWEAVLERLAKGMKEPKGKETALEVIINRKEIGQRAKHFLEDKANLGYLNKLSLPYDLVLQDWYYSVKDGSWHFPWCSAVKTFDIDAFLKKYEGEQAKKAS